MNLTVIRILNTLLAALLAGSLFGSWMGYNPADLSALAYTEQQQNAIRSLNTLMPVLGLITIIVTIIAAFYQKRNKKVFISLLVAAGLLVMSAVVTRFGNQPINAVVMTWSTTDIPADWKALRDSWWTLHIVRTIASLAALLLIIIAGTRNDRGALIN